MKIAHFIQCRYPLKGYGGTERAAYWLGKAQAEHGHEVTYICQPGSELPFARCVPFEHGFTDLTPFVPKDIELVHLWGTPLFRLDFPFLITIEGNGHPGESFHPNSVFVSENHAQRHGWSEFVYNGLDLDEYPLHTGAREEALLFLAKASWPVKNLKGAIRLAQSCGLRLHVAGGKAPFWKFGVSSHGMIDGAEKMKLLEKCQALLFPVLWEEPFGIATIEALASGMPVIASPRGALPEIVDASCGVLSDDFETLCEGIRKRKSFAPEACRARVEKNFTHRHMAEKYEHCYKKILATGMLRKGRPEIPANVDPSAAANAAF